MGIKFLNLPWRFYLMGITHIPCMSLHQEARRMETIKLFKPDGVVKTFTEPVVASELMAQFPKHLVCHSDSFVIGQKIPSLSETDQLQLGHNYFLLPNNAFNSVLSFVTLSSFASSSEKLRNAFLKNSQPFQLQKTASGCLRVRVSEQFLSKLMEEEKEEDFGKVCTTAQLQKDYKRLVRQSQWKPNLETIKESEKRKLSSSFGMKKRKKSQSKNAHKNQRPEQHRPVASMKPPSRNKIKFRLRK